MDDITWQISQLDTSLHDGNSQNQLVVDKYLKECGLQYEDDEEEFGYGRLVIDYKPPKPVTKSVTDKGIMSDKTIKEHCAYFIHIYLFNFAYQKHRLVLHKCIVILL